MVTCNSIQNSNLCTVLGAHLKHLYLLLEPLQIFSEGLLDDFLVIHRSVCFFSYHFLNDLLVCFPITMTVTSFTLDLTKRSVMTNNYANVYILIVNTCICLIRYL